MDNLNHKGKDQSDKEHPLGHVDKKCCQMPDEALKHLHKAEHNLEEALEKERSAEREVARAEAEMKEAIREVEHPRQFTVEILYDGVKKTFEVRIEETVKHLLDQAIRAFGPLPNPHTLSLYRDGKELADSQTIKEAGVKPCDVLLLRPSTVKGGA
jgi:hypothetical protein